MKKSILDNCGVHSDKLIEIYNNIINTKIKNGEKVSENDTWTLESDIYQAYQTILSVANDGNEITKGLMYLKQSLENTGNITNLSNLAVVSVQKAALENRNIQNDISVNEKNANVVMANEILETNTVKVIDNLFDAKMFSAIDLEVQKINAGDKEAYSNLLAFENAAKAVGKYNKLNPTEEKTTLIRMMRLAAGKDSQANESLLVSMAEKYGFDILEKDADDNLVVNEEKLTRLYQSKMPIGSRASFLTIESFKEINEKIGEKAREEGRLDVKDGISPITIKEEITKKAIKEIVRKQLLEEIYKNEGKNIEKISELYVKYPEIVKEILKDRIEDCNKMQERGRNNSVILKVNNEINILNEVIQLNKENTKNVNGINKKDEFEEFYR